MLMLPLSAPMTAQLGTKTGKSLRADAAIVIAHDTRVSQADKGPVKYCDE